MVNPTAECKISECRSAVCPLGCTCTMNALSAYFCSSVASLFLPTKLVRQDERRAQGITKAPWQATPCEALYSGKAIGLPTDLRDLRLESCASQVGAALCFGVLDVVLARFATQAEAEEATLNPRRSWHDAVPVFAALAARA